MLSATVDADAQIAGLKAWAERAHKATETGVQEGGEELKGEIQAALGRREYPPASPIGQPPAKRSGMLQDSVFQRTVELVGGFQERVYPSTVYARIHELSGWAGAGHRSFIPKRPYVGPALEQYAPQFRAVMVQAWREAQPGG